MVLSRPRSRLMGLIVAKTLNALESASCGRDLKFELLASNYQHGCKANNAVLNLVLECFRKTNPLNLFDCFPARLIAEAIINITSLS